MPTKLLDVVASLDAVALDLRTAHYGFGLRNLIETEGRRLKSGYWDAFVAQCKGKGQRYGWLVDTNDPSTYFDFKSDPDVFGDAEWGITFLDPDGGFDVGVSCSGKEILGDDTMTITLEPGDNNRGQKRKVTARVPSFGAKGAPQVAAAILEEVREYAITK